MCNAAGISFAARTLEVAGRDVLELGAYSIGMGGSVRQALEEQRPRSYVGVDITPGPGVDAVGSVYELDSQFGPESFDIVVATELLEHLRDWRSAVAQMKRCVRTGGDVLITTRSWGFPFHRGPWDWWRYEPEDVRLIFSDFEILSVERDPLAPGVFVLARKPSTYQPAGLETVALRSIHTGRRQRSAGVPEFTWSAIRRPLQFAKLVAPARLKQALRHREVPSP